MRGGMMAAALLFGAAAGAAHAEVTPLTPQGFSIVERFEIGAAPAEVFAAATGEISGWWDHSFSKPPQSLIIEPRPSGHFIETFEGGGARHATVIYVKAPNALRLEGPLGLSGSAVSFVTTYDIQPAPQGSVMTVSVNAAGQIDAATAEAVAGVWRHFIGERLKPYVEAGCHRDRSRACPAFAKPAGKD